MLGRIAAAAALIALAGCAGMESAGRAASRSPETVSSAAAPVPTTAPAPEAAPPASAQTAPAAPAERPVTASRSGDDETVVVPGTRERQVQPPGGDPRSNAERMQDIRAWDRCVMGVQSAAEADPLRPQLETPEEYCRQSLGMADRTSVPVSRLERR
jgi:hypothetical protein